MSKKILLVNPPGTEQSGFTNPPLGLLYLASTLLKEGFAVQVADGCIDGKTAVESALTSFRPDIVGITCLTPERMKALEVARMAKEMDPSVTIVFGGAHPTIMYRQMLEQYTFIDYVVLGEGERTLLELAQQKDFSQIPGIAYRKDGQVIKNPNRHYVEDIDTLPHPAWHLVDLTKYPAWGEGTWNGVDLAAEPRISVIFSRGCTGHCDFCSTWWIWRGWRHRSARDMVDELEQLVTKHGIRHICFADDALTVDRQATIELCDELLRRELRIAFHVTTRTDCVDEVVLAKLKAAGCYKIAFGIETGSPMLLDKMGKENDIATSERAIRLCKQVGLPVTALMIIGNVGETAQTVQETVDFLKRADPDEIGCVGGLWILPGTKLYRDCVKKGIINDSFWLTDKPYDIYTEEHSLRELNQLQRRIVYYSYGAAFRVFTSKVRKRLIKAFS